MAYLQANTSPVWPPTGLSIAVLLFSGLSFWPGISLGVFLGSIITGAPVLLALGMTVGNTLEAYFAAYILKKKLDFHNELDRLSDVIGLALVSLFSTVVSATIGTASLILFTQTPRSEFVYIWLTWWIGDLLGALVVAPVILVWLNPKFPEIKQKRLVEGIVLVVLISVITWYVFGNTPPIDIVHQAMIYVIFPFIIWAALRFGQHGATISIFLISTIAIWGTVNGLGPFGQDTINERLILLQTFMGVVALTSLILAATTIERRKAALALQQRIEDLDTLNNASKTFLGNFDKADIYQTICMVAVQKFNASCAWIDMPDMDNGAYAPVAAFGISLKEILAQKVNILKKIDLKDLKSPVVLPDVPGFQNRSFGAFPLVFGNSTLGVLNLTIFEAIAFSDEKIVLIQSFANLAAVAIQNAWLFDEVNRGNEQLHALSQRLMKAQEEERLHLSRELHDESGQVLAALMVELGLLKESLVSRKKSKNI